MQKINRSLKRGSFTLVSILLVLTLLLSSTAFAVSTFDLSATGDDIVPERKHIMGTITSLNDSVYYDRYGLVTVNAAGAAVNGMRDDATSTTLRSSTEYREAGSFDYYMMNSGFDLLKVYRRYDRTEYSSNIVKDSVHIYELNEDGSKGAEIGRDTLPVEYHDVTGTQDYSNGYGYALISGLASYSGDIYIEAESYGRRTLTDVNIIDAAGEMHSGSLTVTPDAKGNFNKSTNATTYDASTMSATQVPIYTDASYTLSYDGTDKSLRMAEFIYPDAFNNDVTLPFKAEGGTIKVDLPKYIYNQNGGSCVLNVYFDDSHYTDDAEGSYSVTVKANYVSGLDDTAYQTIEFYNDTTQDATDGKKLANGESVTFNVPLTNFTPTFNVKDSRNTGNKVSVTSVAVKNSNGDDITVSAFGDQKHYDYFIESTKMGVFGYFELRNISEDITIEVNYGEPMTAVPDNNGNTMYTMNVVTKGDVGRRRMVSGAYTSYPAFHAYGAAGDSYTTYTVEEGYTESNRGKYYGTDPNFYDRLRDGGQIVTYWNYYGQSFTFYTCDNYAYIKERHVYDSDGNEVTGTFGFNPTKISKSTGVPRTYGNYTIVVTYGSMTYKPIKGIIEGVNELSGVGFSEKIESYAPGTNSRSSQFIYNGREYDTTYQINVRSNEEMSGYLFHSETADELRIYRDVSGFPWEIIKDSVEIYKLDAYGNLTDEPVPESVLPVSYTASTGNSAGYAKITGVSSIDYGIYIKAKAFCRRNKFILSAQNAEGTTYRGTLTLTKDSIGNLYSNATTTNGGSALSYTSSDADKEQGILSSGTYTLTYKDPDTLKDGRTRELRLAALTYNDADGEDHVEVFNAINGIVDIKLDELYYPYNVSKTMKLDVYFNDTNIVPQTETTEKIKFKYSRDDTPTGSDTTLEPVTVITAPFGSTVSTSQTVTTTDCDSELYYVSTEDGAQAQIKVGNSAINAANAFSFTNLVYTLKSYDETETYAAFRVFNDKVYPIGCDSATLDKYLSFTHTDLTDSTRFENLYLTVKLPAEIKDKGMSVTFTPMQTYIPLTVHQYILNSDGSATEVGTDDGFSARIYSFYGGSSTYAQQKSFTKEYPVDGDYYDLINASATDYFDTEFTVNGGEDKRLMFHYGTENFRVAPTAKDGYMFSHIEVVPRDKAGNEVTANTGMNSVSYNNSGFATINGASALSRNTAWEINVYYAADTRLILTQYSPSQVSGNFSNIKFVNAADASNAHSFRLSTSFSYSDSVTVTTGNGAGLNEDSYRVATTDIYTHNGVQPQFTITPLGARKLESVEVYTLDGETKTPIDYTLTDGVYTLSSPFVFGDQIHIDVVYKAQQTLTVNVMMLGANGTSAYQNTDENIKVTVDGETNGEEYSFNSNANSFTTSTGKTVELYANTKLTIKTEIPSTEEYADYAVANVKLSESDKDASTKVTPAEVEFEDPDKPGEMIKGKNYAVCTIDSLAANQNGVINVYIAKIKRLNVSVYSCGTDGKYPDEPNGVPVSAIGSYVDIHASVSGSYLSQYSFVTKTDEGKYSTDDFQITYSPSKRTVTAVQGTEISVFAQLPEDGEYVVSRVEGVGFTAANVGRVYTHTDAQGKKYLRVDINTTGRIMDNSGEDYDLKIYITPAQTITTRATTKNIDGSITEQSNGRIRVDGTHPVSGTIPFTVIKPNVNNVSTYYNISSSGNSYSETKCVSDTKLTFTVTPNNNFRVSSVEFIRNGTKLTYTVAAGDGDVMIYTLNEAMHALYDLEFHVEFESKNSGVVRFKMEYTDDYSEWRNAVDLGTIHAGATNYSLDVSGKSLTLLTDLQTNDMGNSFTYDKDNKEGFPGNADGYYEIEVVSGSTFSASISDYINGWYIPLEQTLVRNNKDGSKTDFSTSNHLASSNTAASMWVTVGAEEDYTYTLKLVPSATYDFFYWDRNRFGDDPEDVLEEFNSSLYYSTLNGVNNQTYPDGETYPERVFKSGTWKTSVVFDGRVTASSTFTSIVTSEDYISPGKVVTVKLYEFEPDFDLRSLKTPEAYAAYDTTNLVYTAPLDPYTHFHDVNYTVQRNKQYMVVVVVDNIDFWISCSTTGPKGTYLVYPKSEHTKDFNLFRYKYDGAIGTLTDLEYEPTKLYNSGRVRLPQAYEDREGDAYFVCVFDAPKEKIELQSITFFDYKRQQTVDVKDEMYSNYRAVTNADGSVQYYWYFKINDLVEPDTNAVDNSMRVRMSWHEITTPTPTKPNPDKPTIVTVSQFDRVDYNKYESSTEDAVTVTDTTNKDNLKDMSNAQHDSITFTGETGMFQVVSGDTVRFEAAPRDGYIPEYLEIITANSTSKHSFTSGAGAYRLTDNDVQVNIYYYRPAIRITTTNEADTPKVEIDVTDNFGSSEQLIGDTDYSQSMMVDAKSRQLITIKPLTYETTEKDEGGNDVTVTKKYEVKSIMLGSQRDNMTPIYADGEVLAGYSITEGEDGNLNLLLNSVDNDIYIFVQMIGELVPPTAQVIIAQYYLEKDEDGNDIEEPCYDVQVDVAAAPDKAMNHGGTDVTTFSMNGTETAEDNRIYTDEATLKQGSKLWVTPIESTLPEDYAVKSFTAVYQTVNGNSELDIKDNEISFGTNGSPDSGVIYVKLVYATQFTDFTLNYRYKSRADSSDPDQGYYDGEQGETEKLYTKTISLKKSQLDENGNPAVGILMEYAPAVSDLYKDCKWVFDGQESHVRYGENNTVDITADQPVRKYSVEFRYNDESGEQKTVKVEQAALNSLIKPNGDFVTAPSKNGDDDFSYWLVQDKDSPIKDSEGNITSYREIAKCYNTRFNLRVTGNMIVTAMYNAEVNLISITDPVFTREQTTDESGSVKSDILYADFILAYMKNNGLSLNEQGDDYKTGLIIEQNLNMKLNKEDIEGATVTDEERQQAITAYASYDVLTADTAKGVVKAGNTSLTDGNTRYLFYAVSNENYNNMNRVDKSWAVTNAPIYRQLVMRAYYYVYNVSEDTLELSDPVYFYFYDIGNSKSDTSVAATGSAATPDEVPAPAKEDQK